MKEQDFPALYQAADAASGSAQSSLLLFHRLNNAFLISAAALAALGTNSRMLCILSAIIFLALLFLFIYERFHKPQEKWYQCRALAESIKTSTWRFIMGADPFNNVIEAANTDKFNKLLVELLGENKNVAQHLDSKWADKDEITGVMLDLRKSPYDEKRAVYSKNRIDDQRSWYAKKTGDNRAASLKWFQALCFLYGAAILLLLTRIAEPTFLESFPIDVIAVAASCIVSWMQLKRFDDLASAYNLTAHEIGIIAGRFSSVNDAEHLSRFVSDAENAFSREHTQWAARRDH